MVQEKRLGFPRKCRKLFLSMAKFLGIISESHPETLELGKNFSAQERIFQNREYHLKNRE